MSFQSGSFRISPQDASMHSEFRHTIQRAIDRIHKPAIQSSQPLPIIESDQKYEHDVEPIQPLSTVESEQTPATITFEDILGMDKMELEQLHREKSKWKLEKELLWDNMIQFENTIRTLKQEKKELEDIMKDVMEVSIKESDELRHELGHRQMEVFHWREEMKVFRESLVKYHNDHTWQHIYFTHQSTYIDDVMQTIIESIQEIEKTECIMNMFYCSFDEFAYNDRTSPSSTIHTYAKIYLITNIQLYEIQGYYKGKLSLEQSSTSWDSRGIHLRGGSSKYDPMPTNLEYGRFYRFNPIASVRSNMNWYALSKLIHATKGHIGKSVESYTPHGMSAGYSGRSLIPHDDKQASNIYFMTGSVLQQIMERYVKNVIELVTE
jgi:hypothetical protein